MTTAILPCNGLDKPFGPLSREVALCLAARTGGDLVCPVLLNQAPDRYREILAATPLTVIDGCATRCASKLAARLDLKVDRKVFIPEEVKKASVKPENTLVPGPQALAFARQVAGGWTADGEAPEPAPVAVSFPPPGDVLRVTVDKFVFKFPSGGFLFNENDCWAQVLGNRARVGVSDYVQQSLTDITWFEPPEISAVVEQFGDLGQVESSKAVMEIVSPVSGRVVAVNTKLKDKPEWINEDPYGRGWIAELELTNVSEDMQFLLGPDAYAEAVRRKAMEAVAK
ncbi:MAG: glycine cleavage system protein H [Acidobacteria bacterium]|nr:glycine cleavage system protein H [Acidobacteriota bacterium]